MTYSKDTTPHPTTSHHWFHVVVHHVVHFFKHLFTGKSALIFFVATGSTLLAINVTQASMLGTSINADVAFEMTEDLGAMIPTRSSTDAELGARVYTEEQLVTSTNEITDKTPETVLQVGNVYTGVGRKTGIRGELYVNLPTCFRAKERLFSTNDLTLQRVRTIQDTLVDATSFPVILRPDAVNLVAATVSKTGTESSKNPEDRTMLISST